MYATHVCVVRSRDSSSVVVVRVLSVCEVCVYGVGRL